MLAPALPAPLGTYFLEQIFTESLLRGVFQEHAGGQEFLLQEDVLV